MLLLLHQYRSFGYILHRYKKLRGTLGDLPGIQLLLWETSAGPANQVTKRSLWYIMHMRKQQEYSVAERVLNEFVGHQFQCMDLWFFPSLKDAIWSSIHNDIHSHPKALITVHCSKWTRHEENYINNLPPIHTVGKARWQQLTWNINK